MSVNLAKQSLLKRKAAERKPNVPQSEEDPVNQEHTSVGSELKAMLQSVEQCKQAIERPKEEPKHEEDTNVELYDEQEDEIPHDEEPHAEKGPEPQQPPPEVSHGK